MPPALPNQQLSFTTSPLIGSTAPARLSFLTKVIVLTFEYLALAFFFFFLCNRWHTQCMVLNNNLQYNKYS